MLRKTHYIGCLCALIACFFTGVHSTSIASTPTTSSISNNLYRNIFFKFKLQIPEGWHFIDHGRIEDMNKKGENVVVDGKGVSVSEYEKSKKNSFNLFTAFQFPVGSTSTFNPSINCTAERIEKRSSTKNGKDYLVNMSKIISNIKNANVSVEINGDIKEITFGGKTFYVLLTDISAQNVKGFQKYYATILNGYALNFIVNFTDRDQQEVMEKSLNSLAFY